MRHNAHVCEWKERVCCYTHITCHPAYRDENNCTVKALRNAFGLSFPAAYEALKAYGRKHGSGLPWASYLACVKQHAKQRGLKVEVLKWSQARRDYGKTVVSAQRRLAKGETVIFNVRGHTMCYRDGYTNDWADGRRHHINSIWRIA